MFPDKGDAFLRKWEPTIVPKLLKLAALEKKEESTEDESAGKVDNLKLLLTIWRYWCDVIIGLSVFPAALYS